MNRTNMSRKQIWIYAGIFFMIMIGLIIGNEWNQKRAGSGDAADTSVTVYFVRHGQTESNVLGLLVGSGGDYSLTETGEEQAKERGEALSDVKFTEAYSSELSRAIQTRDLIIAENENKDRIVIQELSGLNDISWGDAEGMTSEEAAEAFDGFSFDMAFGSIDDSAYESPVHAESLYEFVHRFDDTITAIVTDEKLQGDTILVVAHNSMQFWMNHVLEDAVVDDIENAQAVVMIYENGNWRLAEE